MIHDRDISLDDDIVVAVVAMRGTATLCDVIADLGPRHADRVVAMSHRLVRLCLQKRLANGEPYAGAATYEVYQ